MDEIPESFLCPITQSIFIEPVTIHCGHTFEKSAITEWLQNSPSNDMVCPVCRHKRYGDQLVIKRLNK